YAGWPFSRRRRWARGHTGWALRPLCHECNVFIRPRFVGRGIRGKEVDRMSAQEEQQGQERGGAPGATAGKTLAAAAGTGAATDAVGRALSSRNGQDDEEENSPLSGRTEQDGDDFEDEKDDVEEDEMDARAEADDEDDDPAARAEGDDDFEDDQFEDERDPEV